MRKLIMLTFLIGLSTFAFTANSAITNFDGSVSKTVKAPPVNDEGGGNNDGGR